MRNPSGPSPSSFQSNLASLAGTPEFWPAAAFVARIAINGQPINTIISPLSNSASAVQADFPDCCLIATFAALPDGFRQICSLYLKQDVDSIDFISLGFAIPLQELEDFRLHPLPFRVGLDGRDQMVRIDQLGPEFDCFAEGWILENGLRGLLVFREPSETEHTCFVPASQVEIDGLCCLQIGSIGPDGSGHQNRNYLLEKPQPAGEHSLPVTRYLFFEGAWEDGVRLYRCSLEESLQHRLCSAPGLSVTYNTFHDFGPEYNREKILSALPRLADLGIGLLHLDPGWETSWGTMLWDDEKMGAPEDLVSEAQKHNLVLGVWTSLHTREPGVWADLHALGPDGTGYIAEQFGDMKLHSVCPCSQWAEVAESRLSRLVKAGFRFINSDFHDWPWHGQSCHHTGHQHSGVPDRLAWAKSVNDMFSNLHKYSPDLVVEMHDHVESGEYRTPVWYLYAQPNSYDEKWAYEFMWTTYQDLLDRKLFALYHLRKAQPVPLYLHINMMTDNDNALAFWYVASCITHIGVGGALQLPEHKYQAYKRAIATYNKYLPEFTRGRFIGIDELTHLHLNPDGRSGVLVCFNLSEKAVRRTVFIDETDWALLPFVEASSDIPCRLEAGRMVLSVSIEPLNVSIIRLE